MNLIEKIKHWYHGTMQEPYVGSTRTAAFFAFQDNKRYWSARLAHALVACYVREWKWVWATVFALIGVYVALKKL